jgi:3-dehydroquinate dehydratase-2
VRIAVLNGPSLNLLGTREPHLYGTTTLAELESRLVSRAHGLGVELEAAQYNGEGQLIDAIHALRGRCDGLVINAAAYTHTSLAIRDALQAVRIPYVEVHLTNIHAREPERRHSWLSAGAQGVIVGFGALGYELALDALVTHLKAAGVGA